MTTEIQTRPHDIKPNLSVSEWLWLQSQKRHLQHLSVEMSKMEHRLNKQAIWIMLLVLIAVILTVLSVSLVVLVMTH